MVKIGDKFKERMVPFATNKFFDWEYTVVRIEPSTYGLKAFCVRRFPNKEKENEQCYISVDLLESNFYQKIA